MHKEANNFITFIKSILPDYFKNKVVLDIGSGDINGNNRFMFDLCDYSGNDLIKAKNVTIVCKTKDLPYQENHFDTIISTECFEHDPEHGDSLRKIVKMLKPSGLFLFTCASTGRKEHGTRRSNPNFSYGTIGKIDNWSNYYKNLTIKDINKEINLNKVFTIWDSYYNNSTKDLYFVGIKKDKGRTNVKLQKYVQKKVIKLN